MSGSPKDHATDLTRRSQSTYIPLLATLVVLLITLTVTGCGNAQGSPAQGAQNLKLNAAFPNGTAGLTYNSVVSVSGGNAPYHFSVNSGNMPEGLTLNAKTGSVSGTPTTAGVYFFQIDVTDAPMANHGSQTFIIRVRGQQHHNQITVSITPSSATVSSTQKQQFTASVTGTANTGVTWTASPGSIDATGMYTAPSVSTQTSATVTATSNVDSSAIANATLTITPQNTQNPPTITTTSLPGGQQGSAYDDTLAASGGTLPYSWSVASGTLPIGVTLSSAGELAGLPSASGTYNFTVAVTDAHSLSTQKGFSVNVASGGNFDGPAELPRATVNSDVSSTPAPGNVISVQAGGSLQTALNNAQCGDTIQLQAGATFTGLVRFPAKPCDDNHWIIVRTNATDSALPAEGQRLTPCYAGVASLPNRPQYACSNPQNVMARLSYSMNNTSGPIIFANGANHYRLIGLEITRPADKTALVTLINGDNAAAVDHVIFDRLWVHGTAQEETRRGIFLDGFTNTAIVDSYFNDFHCVAGTGTCTDSQTVAAGLGNVTSGIWKIDNNFLEAAGENILFGGGASTVVPSDITVTHNHFYKVPQWQRGAVGFVGGYDGNPFVVKNHFEVKNGARILLDSNLFEYNWGGFSQVGYSLAIAPRNDRNSAGVTNLCSVCEGADVTLRNNRISHVGAGITLAAVVVDGLGAQAAGRVSIHDVIVEDIAAQQYNGAGDLFLIMNGWPANVLNSLSIRHVTGFPDPNKNLLIIGNSLTDPEMTGLTFSDNLVVVPKYPVWSSGKTNDCSASAVPITVMQTCFTAYSFTNNVLTATPSAFPASKWPTGNMFPTAVTNVQMANFNGGNGGDYTLLSTSPYKGQASDGRDPGADISAVNAAVQGVN